MAKPMLIVVAIVLVVGSADYASGTSIARVEFVMRAADVVMALATK
jgi:hypothetical protein